MKEKEIIKEIFKKDFEEININDGLNLRFELLIGKFKILTRIIKLYITEGIKQGRKQLAEEILKNIENKKYLKCPDCKAEDKPKCIQEHWLFKKLQKEAKGT